MHYISNPYSYFSHPHPAFGLGIDPPHSASASLPQLLAPTPQTSMPLPVQPVRSPRMPCISRAASASLQAARAASARRANTVPLEKNYHQSTALARRCISARPSTPVSFSPQGCPSPEEQAQMERIMEIRRKITAQQLFSEDKDLGMTDASHGPASDRQQGQPETSAAPRNFFDIALEGIELMLQDCHNGKSRS